jgi:hypothetical protein
MLIEVQKRRVEMIDQAKRALKALGLTALSMAAMVGFGGGQMLGICASGSDHHQAPALDLRLPDKNGLERAVFAGGCFWGTQYSFQKLAGVSLTASAGAVKGGHFKEKPGDLSGIVSTAVGYTGGHF